jgi:hypothetical protein
MLVSFCSGECDKKIQISKSVFYLQGFATFKTDIFLKLTNAIAA